MAASCLLSTFENIAGHYYRQNEADSERQHCQPGRTLLHVIWSQSHSDSWQVA